MEAIPVVIESVSTSLLATILPWTTGIVLPVALFFVSKIFSSRAEESANKFTIGLHKEERSHFQKLRAFEILNEVYKNCHRLSLSCAKKKRADNLVKMFSEANEKIVESGNQQVILQQQENLASSILMLYLDTHFNY